MQLFYEDPASLSDNHESAWGYDMYESDAWADGKIKRFSELKTLMVSPLILAKQRPCRGHSHSHGHGHLHPHPAPLPARI